MCPFGRTEKPSNRLLTIPISHFCKKARRALDRAGVGYVEERHVQGIHRIAARRAGGGTTVPVLVTEDGVFAESEVILRYVAVSCTRAGRPAAEYALMLELKGPMLRVNNQGVPAWEGGAMSAL